MKKEKKEASHKLDVGTAGLGRGSECPGADSGVRPRVLQLLLLHHVHVLRAQRGAQSLLRSSGQGCGVWGSP